MLIEPVLVKMLAPVPLALLKVAPPEVLKLPLLVKLAAVEWSPAESLPVSEMLP